MSGGSFQGAIRGGGKMLHKVGLFIAFLFLNSTSAWAGSHFESSLSSCTTINCAGMTIRGQQQSNEPFVIQVYAREGECLRLDISTQTEDTALLIVAPAVLDTGSSDDVVGTRPIFGLDPVPATGWYTIAVSYFDYDPRISRFTLEYGRYNSGNLNCSQASAAQAMAPARLKGTAGPSEKTKLPAAETADPAGQRL